MTSEVFLTSSAKDDYIIQQILDMVIHYLRSEVPGKLLMNNKREKPFDAVRMMREIREKLVKEYASDPEKEEHDLEKIRKKYGLRNQKKTA